MSPEEKGMHNEERFLKLASIRIPSTPTWYIGIQRAAPGWDVRGIDAFIGIEFPDGLPGTIPVQIKSSVRHAQAFQEEHPGLLRAGIVIMIVNDHRSDELIYTELYRDLRHLRWRGERFEGFLKQLAKTSLSERGEKIRDHLEQRRTVVTGT